MKTCFMQAMTSRLVPDTLAGSPERFRSRLRYKITMSFLLFHVCINKYKLLY